MNTYFNYQAKIRSLDVARAISIPKGIGPFTGFGHGVISSSNTSGTNQTQSSYQITLFPEYYDDNKSPNNTPLLNNYSFLVPLIKDIREKHGISTNEQIKLNLNAQDTQDSLGSPVTFGVITKDGFIAVNNISSWSVPISNYSGGSAPKEVVVFARHTYVAEAVDNPVTLEAYALNYGMETYDTQAGGSSDYSDINSFYDLFRRSMDIYYNQDDTPDFSSDNPLSNENRLKLKLSFTDLMGYVKSKCSAYADNPSELTLIGIYGNGSYVNESGQSTNEPFAIVPYEGKWPFELPFNTAVMNCLTKNLKNVQSVQDGFPFSVPNTADKDLQNMGIKAYIDYQIKQISESLSNQQTQLIPSGLICLWDQENIPEGWHEYEAARGRLVIGFKSEGIPAGPNGSTILNNLKGTSGEVTNTSDWQVEITSQNLPKHLHVIAMGCTAWTGESSADMDNPVPADWKNYNSGLGSGNNSSDANVRKSWSQIGMQNGAIKSGPNLTTTDTGASYQSNNAQGSESTKLQKILPSITLMYIQKD